MKQILTLLLPLMLFFTACEENEKYYPAGKTIITSIAPGEWTYFDQRRTLSHSIYVPELTYDFNEYGAVLVYLSFDGVSYEQIPQVFKGEAYSFTTEERSVTINKQSYSSTQEVLRPEYPVDVKIVLIDSY